MQLVQSSFCTPLPSLSVRAEKEETAFFLISNDDAEMTSKRNANQVSMVKLFDDPSFDCSRMLFSGTLCDVRGVGVWGLDVSRGLFAYISRERKKRKDTKKIYAEKDGRRGRRTNTCNGGERR